MHPVPGGDGKGGDALGQARLGSGAHRGSGAGDGGCLDLRVGASGDEPGEDGAEAFPRGGIMSEGITFELDGVSVEAMPGETLWQVATRRGTEIPHLCYSPAPGYRADGNCRACMVEIEGERVLAASCIRKPTAGMKVHSASERAKFSRQMVFELLVGDQPERE